MVYLHCPVHLVLFHILPLVIFAFGETEVSMMSRLPGHQCGTLLTDSIIVRRLYLGYKEPAQSPAMIVVLYSPCSSSNAALMFLPPLYVVCIFLLDMEPIQSLEKNIFAPPPFPQPSS